MPRFSIQNAVCAFAAFFLLATQALAACEQSPKVLAGVSDKQKEDLLKQCKAAGIGMHDTCDAIPACGNGTQYTDDQKKKFAGQVQICINKRRSITSTWYPGQGDAGHDIAVDNKINQLNKCLGLKT
jgi:hypothetical protein